MFSTIGKRLALLIMLPLLMLSAFALLLVWNNYQEYQKASQTRQLLEVAVATGDLIHRLQIERGASAGFLQSQGQRFADKLPAVRARSDAELQRYRQVAANYQQTLDLAVVQQVEQRLQRLATLRAGISGLNVAARDSAAYFSDTIAFLLQSIGTLGQQNERADIARRLLAYQLLIQGKENAGLERALSVPVFVADQVSWPQYRAILARIDRQGALFDAFGGVADADEGRAVQAVLGGEQSAKVQQYRDSMAAHFASGGFAVDAEQWFAVSTARIDGLFAVEQALATRIAAQTQALESAAWRGLWWVALAGMLTVLFTAGCGWWVAHSIGRPLLGVAAQAEQRVAARDLIARLPVAGMRETQRIATVFNTLLAAFARLVLDAQRCGRDIGSVAAYLASSSQQVRHSVALQSEAATAVSSALEQTSASMSEVAGNAREVSTLMQQMRDGSGQAQQRMREAVSTVQAVAGQIQDASHGVARLDDSSRQIGGIVQVITDIAEQTGLLALNAAIEAARAGEAGRGFAVVADEVRKLAERTSHATGEIGRLIGDVQQRIAQAVAGMQQADLLSRQGLQAVAGSESALQQIGQGAQQVAQYMQDMAGAIAEQDQALRGISSSMEQIARMTEENSVAAHDSSQHAAQLDDLSRSLAQAVGEYRVAA